MALPSMRASSVPRPIASAFEAAKKVYGLRENAASEVENSALDQLGRRVIRVGDDDSVFVDEGAVSLMARLFGAAITWP